MAIDVTAGVAARIHAIARAAQEWRDPASEIRDIARRALAGGMWPAPVVEAALDNALWDLDAARVTELARAQARETARVLVVLPGNVIGPAIQSAFCAAVAGASAILKSAGGERHLASILAGQFEASGSSLAGTVKAEYWQGGDLAPETNALQSVGRVIAFGEDATIEQIGSRARALGKDVVAYGESYSVGFVSNGSDIAHAAARASTDVCLFDQRGCMSPQTIYVEGDRGRAVLFARTLASEIGSMSARLPRAEFEADEPVLVADAIRRLSASALESTPHGLDTLVTGPANRGVPEFAVVVESFGQPTCIGFGRIVIVKPCNSARDVATQLRYYGRAIESIGLSDGASESDSAALRRAGPNRMCALGDMQRPPFGYRPAVSDFLA